MSKKQDTFTLGLVTLTLILFLIIVGAFSIYYFRESQPTLEIWQSPIIAEHQSTVPVLWVRNNIYINKDEQTLMTAVNGKLFFIGSDTSNKPSRLHVIDAITGNTFNEYGNGTTLATSTSMVFIGGVGNVTARNPDTGKIIWFTNLPFTRSVTKILVLDKTLYVDTVSKNLFILETETGAIADSISYATGDVPSWSDNKMDLEIVGNDMYFDKLPREPSGEGKVSSMDKLSGIERWSVNVSMTSRVNASSLGIFLLASDGWVLRLDSQTGAKNELLQFAPAPVKWGSTREYGYYVTVDVENRLLFVYLGDSAQLFAFRMP
jgi:outer membrane protein assembly factor BamB